MKKHYLLLFLFFNVALLFAQEKEVIHPISISSGVAFRQIIPSSNGIGFNGLLQNNNIIGCILLKDNNYNNVFAKAYQKTSFITRIEKVIKIHASTEPYNITQVIALASYEQAVLTSPKWGLVYNHVPVILWLDPTNGSILNAKKIDGLSSYRGVSAVDMVTDGNKFDILLNTIGQLPNETCKINFLHMDLNDPTKNFNKEIFLPSNPNLFLSPFTIDKAFHSFGSILNGDDGVFITGLTGNDLVGNNKSGFLLHIHFHTTNPTYPDFEKSISFYESSSSGLKSIASGFTDGQMLVTGQKSDGNIFSVSLGGLLYPNFFPPYSYATHEFIPEDPTTIFPLRYKSTISDGVNGGGIHGYVGLTNSSPHYLKNYKFGLYGELVEIRAAPVSNVPYVGQNLGYSSTFGMLSSLSTNTNVGNTNGSGDISILSQRLDIGTDNLAKFYYLRRIDYNNCIPPTSAIEVPFTIIMNYNQFSFTNGPTPFFSTEAFSEYNINLSTQYLDCHLGRSSNLSEEVFTTKLEDLKFQSRPPTIGCDVNQYNEELLSALVRPCNTMIPIPEEGFNGMSNDLLLNKSLDKNDLTIYPNPSHDFFIVNAANIKSIEVFNTSGQSMLGIKNNDKKILQIDCKFWSKGLYIVKLISSFNKIHYKKMIIN